MEYIYLIHLREFILTGQHVYKIGRTNDPLRRMSEYPKSSIIMLVVAVSDSKVAEYNLVRDFMVRYRHRADIGNEYFEGPCADMISQIMAQVQIPVHRNVNNMGLLRKRLTKAKWAFIRAMYSSPYRATSISTGTAKAILDPDHFDKYVAMKTIAGLVPDRPCADVIGYMKHAFSTCVQDEDTLYRYLYYVTACDAISDTGVPLICEYSPGMAILSAISFEGVGFVKK